MPITIPTKPPSFGWCTVYADLGDTSIIARPSTPKMASGWDLPNEKITRQDINYMLWNLGELSKYIEGGGASIIFNEDAETSISNIEDIDITDVESGTYIYTISGVYTFYPTIPTPIVSTEYMIAPTTPLAGGYGAWILIIPSLNTYLSVLQPETDRLETKIDEHITDNITEHASINAKLGNIISVQTAVATPSSAYTSIANHDSQTKTFTISGLDSSKQYNVDVTPLSGLQDGLNFYAWVSADNTVSVKIINSSNGSLTPTAQSYKFVITE